MLAYYSDFRIDNPEAGTSSDGPLGGGASRRQSHRYRCRAGQSSGLPLQGPFPAGCSIGSPAVRGLPTERRSTLRADLKDDNTHDLGGYLHQLAERTFNGKIPPYDYALSEYFWPMKWAIAGQRLSRPK